MMPGGRSRPGPPCVCLEACTLVGRKSRSRPGARGVAIAFIYVHLSFFCVGEKRNCRRFWVSTFAKCEAVRASVLVCSRMKLSSFLNSRVRQMRNCRHFVVSGFAKCEDVVAFGRLGSLGSFARALEPLECFVVSPSMISHCLGLRDISGLPAIGILA